MEVKKLIKNINEFKEWKANTKEGTVECECEKCHKIFKVRKEYGKGSQSSNHYYRLLKMDELVCPWCYSSSNFKKTRSLKSEDQLRKEQEKKTQARLDFYEKKAKQDLLVNYFSLNSLKKAFENGINAATVICERCKQPIQLKDRDQVRRYVKSHDDLLLCKGCSISVKLNQNNMNKTSEDFPTTYDNTSMEEKSIVTFLRENYDGPIIENTKNIIPPYELDIYLPELKLAIEYCGLIWHSQKSKYYHLDKTILCEQKDIKLIQIYSSEWKYQRKEIEKIILDNLSPGSIDPPLYTLLDRRFWGKRDGHKILCSTDPEPLFTNGNTIKKENSSNFSHPIYDCGKIMFWEGEKDYLLPRELFWKFREMKCPDSNFSAYWNYLQVDYDKFCEMIKQTKMTDEEIVSYIKKEYNL